MKYLKLEYTNGKWKLSIFNLILQNACQNERNFSREKAFLFRGEEQYTKKKNFKTIMQEGKSTISKKEYTNKYTVTTQTL